MVITLISSPYMLLYKLIKDTSKSSHRGNFSPLSQLYMLLNRFYSKSQIYLRVSSEKLSINT